MIARIPTALLLAFTGGLLGASMGGGELGAAIGAGLGIVVGMLGPRDPS